MYKKIWKTMHFQHKKTLHQGEAFYHINDKGLFPFHFLFQFCQYVQVAKRGFLLVAC